MKKRKQLFLSITAFAILILVIYIKRDVFQYQQYSTYNQLYLSQSQPKWNQLKEAYSNEELIDARKELSANNVANLHDSTLKRVLSIGSYIYQKLKKNAGGKPSFLVDSLPTYEAYQTLIKDSTEPLWCGTYSRIFALFCFAADIQCRYIEIINPGDHHVVNETYLPELQQWALVDLTNNNLAVEANSKLLNLVDFKVLLARKAPIQAYHSFSYSTKKEMVNLKNDYIQKYFIVDVPYYYYHTINLKKTYSVSKKLERFFFPVSWYEIYTTKDYSNYLFYIKAAILFTGLLLLIYFVLINRFK